MTKQDLYSLLQGRMSDLTALSDSIWGFAELSLQEYRSAACLADFLENEGFTVERGIAGIETAFCASFGSGKPVIGLLAEYDALDGLQQEAGAMYPCGSGGCGHGCGHHLLGVGSVGAALAVKAYLEEKGEDCGTVELYGCPGEEGLASKAFMAREKLFAHLDAALSWHPGDENRVFTGSNQTSLQVLYTFHGIASHAAETPHMGRSALDAVELMNMGVQFLREHMPRTDSVHYAITNTGGVSPNVVQPEAAVLDMVRSDTVPHAKDLLARVDKIAQGAALMTETTLARRFLDGTADIVPNAVLEQLLYKNLLEAPAPVYTAEEQRYAAALYATYPHSDSPQPIHEGVVPYVHSDAHEYGSSDVGDVSWLTPTSQILTVTYPAGSPGHSWQNVAIGKHSVAHKGMIYAAQVLGCTVVDLFEDPTLLTAARNEWQQKTANGYTCPIEVGVTPCII